MGPQKRPGGRSPLPRRVVGPAAAAARRGARTRNARGGGRGDGGPSAHLRGCLLVDKWLMMVDTHGRDRKGGAGRGRGHSSVLYKNVTVSSYSGPAPSLRPPPHPPFGCACNHHASIPLYISLPRSPAGARGRPAPAAKQRPLRAPPPAPPRRPPSGPPPARTRPPARRGRRGASRGAAARRIPRGRDPRRHCRRSRLRRLPTWYQAAQTWGQRAGRAPSLDRPGRRGRQQGRVRGQT